MRDDLQLASPSLDSLAAILADARRIRGAREQDYIPLKRRLQAIERASGDMLTDSEWIEATGSIREALGLP